MITKFNTDIYFPDILDAATMLDGISANYSYYRDAITSPNENISYKTKMFLGINKVIELANLFRCVFLDKIEFSFIVQEMYRHHRLICLDLLRAGKISFIDNDKHFMFYELREGRSFIQVHKVPKLSNEDLLKMAEKMGDEAFLFGIRTSIGKSIEPMPIDFDEVTSIYFDNLKRGYYQGLGIGINNIIGVNADNKELYDLIAQLTLDLYVCDRHEIPSIYLKEYFYWADKYLRSFKNSIFPGRTRFEKTTVSNIAYALSSLGESSLKNNELLEKTNTSKELNSSLYPEEYTFLKSAFSSEFFSDYENKEIVFVEENGQETLVANASFETYLNDLRSKGQALRQTKLFIKITPQKYLDSFLAGNIKFSKPITFIEGAGRKGQYDKTEATFVCKRKDGKRVCTRNIYDLNYTLIWCCFALDSFMFVDSLEDEKIVKKATVKKEYFDGFFEEDDAEENAIILIKPDVFLQRVYKSLAEKGVVEQDIIIAPVTYIRKSEDFALSCEPPFELFYKDIFYLPQNEVRILIRNSGNKYDYLFDKHGVINVGDIHDICTPLNGMYHEDMECILESESRMRFNLPIIKKP